MRHAIAIALLTAFAAPARAQSPALSVPAVVRGGTTVELAWRGVPAEAREIELLLSVDGARGFSLRVTAELDPRTARLHWRVPNVAADHARLRLRFGTATGEIDGAPSAEFQIVPDASQPPPRWLASEGPWWSGPSEPSATSVALGAPPALGAYEGAAAMAGAPPRIACLRDAAERHAGVPLDGPSRTRARDIPDVRARGVFPLRN